MHQNPTWPSSHKALSLSACPHSLGCHKSETEVTPGMASYLPFGGGDKVRFPGEVIVDCKCVRSVA